jgi:uncharacterized protein
MTLYLDTSALIKNYIDEIGSEYVYELLEKADSVVVSAITHIECFSTLKRILHENNISIEDYNNLKQEISHDFRFFSIVDFYTILGSCEKMIDIYQLKTLDAIQISSVKSVEDEIDYFVGCDEKLNKAVMAEKIGLLNPLKDISA